MNIENDLKVYISKLCRIPISELTSDMQIYNSKIISSLKILEIMSYIEKQFNIIIKPEELILKNFENINTLTEFVNSKL